MGGSLLFPLPGGSGGASEMEAFCAAKSKNAAQVSK
jgi:hypothetical protein